jgi:hypothetical protein
VSPNPLGERKFRAQYPRRSRLYEQNEGIPDFRSRTMYLLSREVLLMT